LLSAFIPLPSCQTASIPTEYDDDEDDDDWEETLNTYNPWAEWR
jgi:hypothetical protein